MKIWDWQILLCFSIWNPLYTTLPEKEGDGQLPQSLSGSNIVGIGDVLTRVENFKHFDTIQDHSDHHYNDSAVKRPSKSCTKRIPGGVEDLAEGFARNHIYKGL
ncbi:hypothetical protein SAY86_010147 [Trapa natans]|uniref:Uncharacterized protein n=1 Tax=Trapa natans TaxID=22666 RepID=A0AAN7KX97_TRANT|nr:hypothetical protein SAY86_010147 [Trapa natans]